MAKVNNKTSRTESKPSSKIPKDLFKGAGLSSRDKSLIELDKQYGPVNALKLIENIPVTEIVGKDPKNAVRYVEEHGGAVLYFKRAKIRELINSRYLNSNDRKALKLLNITQGSESHPWYPGENINDMNGVFSTRYSGEYICLRKEFGVVNAVKIVSLYELTDGGFSVNKFNKDFKSSSEKPTIKEFFGQMKRNLINKAKGKPQPWITFTVRGRSKL